MPPIARRAAKRFVRRHSGGQVLFDLLIEMKTKFGLQFVLDAVPLQQGTESVTNLGQQTHT